MSFVAHALALVAEVRLARGRRVQRKVHMALDLLLRVLLPRRRFHLCKYVTLVTLGHAGIEYVHRVFVHRVFVTP